MKPQQGADPFDLDFDADDEFAAPPEAAWPEPPPAAEAAAADPFADPFADLPPVRESARAEARLAETRARVQAARETLDPAMLLALRDARLAAVA